MKTKCNNCGWEGDDEDLSLFETKGDGTQTIIAEESANGIITRHSERSGNPFFFKGCPNCKSDGYLMDIDEPDDLPTELFQSPNAK